MAHAMGLVLTLAACGGGASSGEGTGAAPATEVSGTGPGSAAASAASATELVVRALPRPALLEAAGVAEPYARATLSTRLMGSVTRVWVREGDRVRAGQPMVSIDSRELAAKASQVEAALAEARAMHREAATHASRIRALYADSAAPRAQLDAAEAGLARAEAAVEAAKASGAELGAMNAYAVVRAPFDGTVTSRMVDEGAFAAPGTPLLTVQDGSRLRVSASASPDAVRGIRRGDTLQATIEDAPAAAVVEGVVPAAGRSLYTVNAIVRNDSRFLPGSAATLSLPQGTRPKLLVPSAALVRQGDLVGVRVRSGRGSELRWVRTGEAAGDSVEVVAGLRDGERIEATAGVGARAGGH
jgi:RND family efflux transporter MFP subunit